MYDDLSIKQLQILKYLKSQTASKGYPPSVREICEAVGLRSTSTVHGHLSRLEERGYIRKDPTKPRAIEILDNCSDNANLNKKIINVPIVGKVKAGSPILAVENIEDTFPLPMDFIGNGDHENIFVLSVKGDSMIDAGILDNDFVIVRKQSNASNNDIVVALIEEDATVKRFFKEKDYIRLQPENQFMEPILVKNVSILGKVIGVFRRI